MQKMTMAIVTAAVICGAAWAADEKNTGPAAPAPAVPAASGNAVKAGWRPLRVCVLDFSSPDIQGQKRFLDEKNKPIEIPAQCTLNDADRKSVNSIMQGFVRMIDAWDTSKTGDANRVTQMRDNEFDRAKALALYNTVVKGESRPLVIGAEYLTAYLGQHGDVFHCIDSAQMTAAMDHLRKRPDFPKDVMAGLARETGATHLIYGTVSDLRSTTGSFKGYGIETKTINYQLDVLIKVVDLVSGHAVYGKVYTGSYRERRPLSDAPFDNNIFQTLMTSALEQAAEDLYNVSKPGPGNKISAAPLPVRLTVMPSGGMFFKPASAEVFIDGTRVGNGGGTFDVSAGKHTVTVKAAGYQPHVFEVDLSADATIDAKLEK